MSLFNKIIDLQKLDMAWEKVRRNKPSAGTDNVTVDMFENNKKMELKQLQLELKNGVYKALPVRKVILYKNEKEREIVLYSMRDKVVQQSIMAELSKLYEPKFSNQSFAYRSNKSAIGAVELVEKEILSGLYEYVLKIDISHFFDTIDWNILKMVLEKEIKEIEVLQLIEENTKAMMLEETGNLIDKTRGIYQGSGISPILSNIYLMNFDHWLTKQDGYYIRYSDDMLILGKSKEQLQQLKEEIKNELQKIGLEINEKKSECVSIKEGFEFLGYCFSDNGKSIPVKAEQGITERLEEIWLTLGNKTIKDKVKKVQEIMEGWGQYYNETRKIGSIFEYVAFLYKAVEKGNCLLEWGKCRIEITNIYKDIMLYLAELWQQTSNKKLELLEYEQYYQIFDSNTKEENREKYIDELLHYYRKLIVLENEETIVELMQIYTDMGEYQKASFWMERKEQMKNSVQSAVIPNSRKETEIDIIFNQMTAQKLLSRFVGREDMYSLEVEENEKRETRTQLLPLLEKNIYEHLCGKVTIGTFIQRPNSTVRYIVFDVDISKKIILQSENKRELFQVYLEKALQKAIEIQKLLQKIGMRGYIEYSGNRGYHVWVLFSEWIPVRYATMVCDVIEEKVQKEEDITIEYFPNKTRLKAGKYGQVIKLPYGTHIKTGEISYFLDDSLEKITDINLFLDNMATFSFNGIKKVLAVHTMAKENTDIKIVDENLEVFKEASENVLEILKKCNLMRYLCQKAVKTGYLTHQERVSILYVFGHLGEEGKQFVHFIMSKTLNYQYNTTEKFILRIKEKPVSCVKLREQYKQLTAEYGCNCVFKRSKNCYPSPVLHVIALSNNLQTDVTLPTSKVLSKENEQKVVDELNIHKKAQELASKILELKKQKRSIDGTIIKIEKELEKIFDSEQVECIEIEMGLLVRRRKEKGYEWIIEI